MAPELWVWAVQALVTVFLCYLGTCVIRYAWSVAWELVLITSVYTVVTFALFHWDPDEKLPWVRPPRAAQEALGHLLLNMTSTLNFIRS